MSDMVSLQQIVTSQLETLFLSSKEETERIISLYCDEAEKRATHAFLGFDNKYSMGGGLNPYNTVMYCNFLFWLSYLAYKANDISIAEKAYYLNKTLNGIDLFYETEMPEYWSCEHPVGTVIGRAKIGNYFFFYQGCNVGGTYHNGELYYPVVGEKVLMYGGSKILGKSIVGDNVILSANTMVLNDNIPSNSLVFGQSPHLVIKENRITRTGGVKILK